MTKLPRNDRAKYQGHDDVITEAGLQSQGQMESVRWWAGDGGCWWTDYDAETIGAHSQLSDDDRSTCVGGGSGTGFAAPASSVNSLELSDLEPTGFKVADYRRRSDEVVEKSRIQDTERGWLDTSRRRSGGGRRCSATDREWVVRRRSDGSRYIRRRGDSAECRRRSAETEDHRTDPARRTRRRSTCHHSPGSHHQQHGDPQSHRSYDNAKQDTEDVVHTLTTSDRWTNASDDDYGTVEWICSPRCTDSNYRIVAVV